MNQRPLSSYKKSGKRPMILFEIMVGLALLSGLLFVLFSFFTSSVKMENKLKLAEKALLERQHVSQRLQSIITSIIPTSDKESSSALYTQQFPEEEGESLVIYFDHGIDPDPAFSGPSLARIYLNKQHQFCLAIWPKEREKGKTFVRHEVLLEGIDHFAFQFLTRKLDESIAWEKNLSENENRPISSLIRLDLWEDGGQEKEPSLQFAFILPSTEPQIVYSAHQGKGKKI
jgi:hypothetical protein